MSRFAHLISRVHAPEAKISEYCSAPKAVIQRGVRMMPSVSEIVSLNPWATACVNIGFFLWVVHKHIDLMNEEDMNWSPIFVRDELTHCRRH